MLQKLRSSWRKWRENSRQYEIDRALYREAGGSGGMSRRADTGTGVGADAGLPSPSAHTPPPEQRSD